MRQQELDCFIRPSLVTCRVQALGRILGRLVLKMLMELTWPTGFWLTTPGPSLWRWLMAAALTTQDGGESVTVGRVWADTISVLTGAQSHT